MSSVLRKRKITDERRVFKKSGRICIFSPVIFIVTSHCLTCQKKIAVMKEYNLHRRCEAMTKINMMGTRVMLEKKK